MQIGVRYAIVLLRDGDKPQNTWKTEVKGMSTKEIRAEVKKLLVAKNGKMINADWTALVQQFNISYTDIQNAYNYFRFSPQQSTFRATYNIQ